MADLDVMALLEDHEPRKLYPHSLFSIGISSGPYEGVGTVVLVHATMGEKRFEFRLTAENARFAARAFATAADNADAANANPT